MDFNLTFSVYTHLYLYVVSFLDSVKLATSFVRLDRKTRNNMLEHSRGGIIRDRSLTHKCDIPRAMFRWFEANGASFSIRVYLGLHTLVRNFVLMYQLQFNRFIDFTLEMIDAKTSVL